MTRSHRLAVLIAIGGFTSTSARAATTTFNDLTLPANSYYLGPDSNPTGGAGTASIWTSAGTNFTHYYDAEWFSWAGFSYANGTDGSTPGFGNQQSSQPGGGSSSTGSVIPGENFALGYHDTFNGIIPTLMLRAGEYLTGFYAANTTYAYQYMLSGLDGFLDNPANKFGGLSGNDPDYMRLTINGYDSGNVLTGTVDYYLADLRFADSGLDFIRTGWNWVDLSALGSSAQKATFALSSSDAFAPSYFAGDYFTTAPEPSRMMLSLMGATVMLLRRLRTR